MAHFGQANTHTLNCKTGYSNHLWSLMFPHSGIFLNTNQMKSSKLIEEP